MIWLYVALTVLFILIIILFLPIDITFQYPQTPNVKVKIWGRNIDIFHFGKSSFNSKSGSESPKSTKNKIFDIFKKRGFLKSFRMMYDILSISGEAMIGLMKRIYVNKIKLIVKTGASSAFSAAMKYGQASSVVYPFMSLVNNIASPKKFIVEVLPDFSGEKLILEFEVNISSNILRILCVMFFLIKKYRKLCT